MMSLVGDFNIALTDPGLSSPPSLLRETTSSTCLARDCLLLPSPRCSGECPVLIMMLSNWVKLHLHHHQPQVNEVDSIGQTALFYAITHCQARIF